MCISSGKRRTCTKLWATSPPSPLSHTFTLANVGRGLPSSWKVGCHSTATWEVDATFIPIWAIDSQTIPPDGREGVLVGTSFELAWVCSAVRCLFQERPEGGEGGVLDLCLGAPAAVGLVGHQAQNEQSSWSFSSPYRDLDPNWSPKN